MLSESIVHVVMIATLVISFPFWAYMIKYRDFGRSHFGSDAEGRVGLAVLLPILTLIVVLFTMVTYGGTIAGAALLYGMYKFMED